MSLGVSLIGIHCLALDHPLLRLLAVPASAQGLAVRDPKDVRLVHFWPLARSDSRRRRQLAAKQ
eukprot:7149380-Pyramimonas_sp.AAC.1